MSKCELCEHEGAILVCGSIADLCVSKPSCYLCLDCVKMVVDSIKGVKM